MMWVGEPRGCRGHVSIYIYISLPTEPPIRKIGLCHAVMFQCKATVMVRVSDASKRASRHVLINV